MSAINKWDIVVLPFPYTDKNTTKNRPALVISNSEFAKKFGLLWVLMITSAKNDAWELDVEIEDLELAKLPAPSKIRCAKIACVEVDFVRKVLGTIGEEIRQKANDHLAHIA